MFDDVSAWRQFFDDSEEIAGVQFPLVKVWVLWVLAEQQRVNALYLQQTTFIFYNYIKTMPISTRYRCNLERDMIFRISSEERYDIIWLLSWYLLFWKYFIRGSRIFFRDQGGGPKADRVCGGWEGVVGGIFWIIFLCEYNKLINLPTPPPPDGDPRMHLSNMWGWNLHTRMIWIAT